MKSASIFDKSVNSIVNLSVVSLVFFPFYLTDLTLTTKKAVFIVLFLVYKVAFIFFNENRTLGMIITKTYWRRTYPLSNQMIHAVLYTASASTLLFWIFYPFDILLVNVLLVQLPSLLFTKMTFQEWIAGKMQAIKKNN